jgi:transposase-like protein
VTLAAVKGEKTLAELAAQFDVPANVIKTWQDQLLEGAAGIFVTIRRVPRLFDLHAVPGAMFCCF